ncbi:MAG: thymidine phosphorylase [Actinobacteria bacterium]|nr:thymidine phosphorylase [Actinomycetota bacterium]
MPDHHAVDVIRTKRDGDALSDEQIRWFIDTYTAGDMADEQASALLMAIFWRGMTARELTIWTATMLASGRRLDLSSLGRPTADKHSTGGVGDKVSLPLAPIVAACGLCDPMLSGRGLGHTGGTLDKLESIPGYRVALDAAEMIDVLAKVGCAICAAGPDLAPADKKLYALRDVTGTVESIPLIASSIMSKKLAEGTEALVLDVKVGSGAFMRDVDSARELAETMVRLGEAHGVKTAALLTNMDMPLGRTAGNALEVSESLDCLRGHGPHDVMEVTYALAEEMLNLAGVDADPRASVESGAALVKFHEMVRAQGGDPDAPLPEASERRTFEASQDGWLNGLDARAVGIAAWRLGAGRARKEDPVSAGAGVVCLKKPGEQVSQGEPLLELHADHERVFDAALAALDDAVDIGPDRAEAPPLIIERITA